MEGLEWLVTLAHHGVEWLEQLVMPCCGGDSSHMEGMALGAVDEQSKG